MKSFRELLDILEIHRLLESVLTELAFSPDTFLSRFKSVVNLAQRGATDGEREAAKAAIERMVSKAKEEAANMSPTDSSQFLRQVQQAMSGPSSSSSNTRTDPPKSSSPPPPQFKVGQWVFLPGLNRAGKITKTYNDGEGYYVDFGDGQNRLLGPSKIRVATQDEIDAATSFKAKYHSGSKSDSKNNSTSDSSNEGIKLLKLAYFVSDTSNKVYGVVLQDDLVFTFWGRLTDIYRIKGYNSVKAAFAQFDTKIAKGYKDVSKSANPDMLKLVNRNLRFAFAG